MYNLHYVLQLFPSLIHAFCNMLMAPNSNLTVICFSITVCKMHITYSSDETNFCMMQCILLQYIMRNLHDVMLAINASAHSAIGNLHTAHAMEFYNYHIVKGLRLITSLLSQYRFYRTANLLTYELSSESISENCVSS